MTRWKWVLLAVVLAVASFALARFAAPWVKYLLISPGGPPPGFVLPNTSYIVPDEGPVRYDRGQTLPAPDQPGWRARAGNEYFGLPFNEFVMVARRTATLGLPEGTGDVRTLPSFVLAALPWMDSDIPEEHPTIVLSKVAQLLRVQKIVAFGNPMALSYPLRDFDGDFWKNPTRMVWLGIPVPPGTEVEKPLVLKEFPGAEVVMTTDDFTTINTEEDWGSVLEKARSAGRETMQPMIHRFLGWRSHPPKVRVQRILPLRP